MTSGDELLARLEPFSQAIAEARAGMREVGREVLAERARELFDRFPAMDFFGWRQEEIYNDEEDVWESGRGVDEVEVNGYRCYQLIDMRTRWDSRTLLPHHAALQGSFEAVAEALADWPDALAQDLFGYAASVIVRRGGRVEITALDVSEE